MIKCFYIVEWLNDWTFSSLFLNIPHILVAVVLKQRKCLNLLMTSHYDPPTHHSDSWWFWIPKVFLHIFVIHLISFFFFTCNCSSYVLSSWCDHQNKFLPRFECRKFCRTFLPWKLREFDEESNEIFTKSSPNVSIYINNVEQITKLFTVVKSMLPVC